MNPQQTSQHRVEDSDSMAFDPHGMTAEQLTRHLTELEAQKKQAEIAKLNRESRWYRPANVVALLTAFAAIIGLWIQYQFSEVRHERELLELRGQLEKTKSDFDDIQRNMQGYLMAIAKDLGVTIKSGREVAIGETTTVSGTVLKCSPMTIAFTSIHGCKTLRKLNTTCSENISILGSICCT